MNKMDEAVEVGLNQLHMVDDDLLEMRAKTCNRRRKKTARLRPALKLSGLVQ